MSRKTIMTVLGFLTTALVFLKVQFGLEIDVTGFIASLGVVLIYLLYQAKMDIRMIGRQFNKFKSKKFWLALASTIVPAVNTAFNLNIPVEIVVGVMGFIMSLIFGKEFKDAN